MVCWESLANILYSIRSHAVLTLQFNCINKPIESVEDKKSSGHVKGKFTVISRDRELYQLNRT